MRERNPNSHPFGKTLGGGPYRYVGMFALRKPSGADPGNLHAVYPGSELGVHRRFVRGAGTCAHCGHAIMNIYQIQIGNGDVFGVGSECVDKSDIPESEVAKMRRDISKSESKKRAVRKVNRTEKIKAEIKALIEARRDEFESKSHPSTDSLSLLDYAEWIIEHSNNPTFALKRIKHALDK